jgi:hypothetical protein
MKKTLFFTLFLPLAAAAFAQGTIPNRYIFIEGTADRADQNEFFMTNFNAEAFGAGYTVTKTRKEAAHTVKFSVSQNMVTGSDGVRRQAPPDDNQYVIKIRLIRNSDEFEIIVFDFFFTELNEMYEYNQFLFHKAVSNIPPLSEDDIILVQEQGHVIDNSWKNKWLYFRASFDYPITFYALQSDGLIGGIGLYAGDFDDPIRTAPIDHKIIAMPGATLGAEIQFLNFMSVELNYQLSLGDTRTNTFINMALGFELKFPIKFFTNFVLAPYAAAAYHFHISEIFNEFPPFAVGGGIQACVRGGKHGAFFVDVNYMFSFPGDTVMKNPYLSFDKEQRLYPKPSEIHYKRSAIGIGIGYKFGILDRKVKPAKTKPANTTN